MSKLIYTHDRDGDLVIKCNGKYYPFNRETYESNWESEKLNQMAGFTPYDDKEVVDEGLDKITEWKDL